MTAGAQDSIRIERHTGAGAAPFLDDLARLRIAVFREFPYLYDGSMEYEREYVATYAATADSLFVLALDGDRVVGAATGLPMGAEDRDFRRPFAEGGWDPERIFYFGESVLLPEYRGRGIGARFLAAREAHATEAGRFDHCCFCAVERPADHPLRPAGYRPLDSFWLSREFQQRPELRTDFSWRDIGAPAKTPHPMVFWMKRIRPC